MDTERELALYHKIHEVTASLEGVRDPDKALRLALREAREFFGADAACLAVYPHGQSEVELALRLGEGFAWELDAFADYLRGVRHEIAPTLCVARVDRRARLWAAVGMQRAEQAWSKDEVRRVRRYWKAVERGLRRLDRARVSDVRARIDRKLMEQVRPKDLFYHVLHGLRSLTHYDHSASLLTHDADCSRLVVVAAQMAWRKGKSKQVGNELVLTAEHEELLARGVVLGFDRDAEDTGGLGPGWREWRGRADGDLAELLDCSREEDQPEGSMIVAPLCGREGLLGVLKVAACSPRALGRWEVDLVQRFVPQVVVAIRNLQRAEDLESGLLRAEKKHVVANLVRGVSHDINNAFGAVLPLVQQMRSDLRQSDLDREELLEDLSQVEDSLQVCRRIFGGMLSFAKGSARSVGEGDLHLAVDSMRAVLEKSLERTGVKLVLELPAELPRLRGGQGDLEQLVLNLAENARDAMLSGGTLTISARDASPWVELVIADTGEGMDPHTAGRVCEPFFTTKPGGNGLGLSICRSILWGLRGKFSLESQPGAGTRVRMLLPVASSPVREEDEG